MSRASRLALTAALCAAWVGLAVAGVGIDQGWREGNDGGGDSGLWNGLVAILAGLGSLYAFAWATEKYNGLVGFAAAFGVIGIVVMLIRAFS